MTLTQPRSRRRHVAGALVGALVATMGVTALTTTPVAAATTNAVVNGDFENGTTAPWEGRVDAKLSVSPDAATGAYSMLVTGRTATQSGPYQSIRAQLEPNTTYAVSAKIKYETGPATRQFFLTSFTGGSSFTNLAGANATKGAWATLSSTITTGATIPATYDIFLETSWVNSATVAAAPGDHAMDFKVDDVSVVKQRNTAFNAVGKLPGNGNPLTSTKFGADPAAFVSNGRVYMYMTNDTQEWAPDANNISPTNTYAKINQITVISSDDLMNWRDEGSIQVAGPNGAATWANNSWAPAVISKVIDGKEQFFLYFANSAGSVGVLVSDSPTGPWRDPIGKPLISTQTPGASANGNWLFDPAPFIDKNGQAYLYFGGGTVGNPANPQSTRWIKLGTDMITTQGSAQVIDAPRVFEASYVFERNGIYYYAYSTNFTGTTVPANYPPTGVIAYLMSTSPEGPWTPAQLPALNNGMMFQNPTTFFGVGGNTHTSYFELNGKFYMAYQAQTLNLALVNGNTSNVKGFRSTHLNEVTFNADGTMNLVQGTMKGVPQVKSLNPFGPVEAETIAWQKGIITTEMPEPAAAGGYVNRAIDQVDNGDWVALANVDFGTAGATSLSAKVKSLVAGTTVDVYLNSPDEEGTKVGTLTVNSPVGQWATVSAALTGATGKHDVYFVFRGAATGDLVQVDNWTFAAQPPAPALDVTAVAGSRCVAGKAMPTVTVTNNEDGPVAVTVTSAGTVRSFASVAAGKNAFHAFTTRQASVSAGSINVAATGTVGGAPVSVTQDVTYPAISCN